MKINAFSKYLLVMSLLLMGYTAAWAVDDDEEGSESTVSSGHWYLGASTGYLKPDGDRLSGNTRTLGYQGGYQFNDKWSLEIGFQQDALSPGHDNLNLHDLNFVRAWGDDLRILFEFGSTHISLDGDSNDGATSGFHVGAGLSAFITDNWELRGDIKLVQTMNGNLHDGLGTLALNYHFVDDKVQSEDEEESILGQSESGGGDKPLPPMEYREPVNAPADNAPAEEPAQQTPEAPVAPTQESPVTTDAAVAPEPAPASMAPESAPAPVIPVAPMAPAAAPMVQQDSSAPAMVLKSTHTLLNFGYNSSDMDTKYGSQLDEISEEIKSTNSKAVVEGHTDNKGSAENNKVLSLDRAIIAKRELKKRGVNTTDIQAVGYGEERPVATNETEEGRAQNRRVEIKVYEK